MFELKIKTDLSLLPKVVETNIDEIEPIVKAALERVNGLVVTDNRDDIIAADEDAAKLTKMGKAIARFRIDHVAIWKEPMEAFETKCKSAEKRLEEAAATLRGKTNEVKDIWRAKKRDTCLTAWNLRLSQGFKSDGDVMNCEYQAAYLAHWCDPKTKGTWVNSSVSMATVEAAMDAEIARMRQTMDAVLANYANEPTEVQAAAKIALLKRFDANDVILAVKAWKEERARVAAEAERMEQAKAKLAQERAKNDAPAAPTPAPVTTPAPTAQAAQGANTTPTAPELVETYKLAITGTRAALKQLRQYGESIGISFAKIAD